MKMSKKKILTFRCDENQEQRLKRLQEVLSTTHPFNQLEINEADTLRIVMNCGLEAAEAIFGKKGAEKMDIGK